MYMVGAGILCLVGFLIVAAGLAQGLIVVGGFAYLSSLVPWGVVFTGVGVALGFLGAAVKGPSMEWQDLPPPAKPSDAAPHPAGIRFACPNCGGDVYASEASCPTCGHRLSEARTPGA